MPRSTREVITTRAFILIGLFLLAGASTLPGQTNAVRPEKCFLWRIDSGATTLYLLGSVHIADDALYPLDPAIEKAFADSGRLVVEVNMLNLDVEAIGQLYIKKGMYGPGETLEKSLSKETLKKLEEFLSRQGLTMDMVNRQRPWLVSMRVSLEEIHRRLEGRGYVAAFAGSRNLRDAEFGVRIDFLVAGQFPGDGKPKPVVFPEPQTAAIEIDGMRFLELTRLVELKLASGTDPGRRRDLGDVQELIRLLALPREFGDQLDLSVRGVYVELWSELQGLSAEA